MPLQIKSRLVCDECKAAEEFWLQQGAVLNHLELSDDYEGEWQLKYRDNDWHQVGSSSASFRITSPTEIPEHGITCSDDCRAAQDAKYRLAETAGIQRVQVHPDNLPMDPYPGGLLPPPSPQVIGISNPTHTSDRVLLGDLREFSTDGVVMTTTGTSDASEDS